MARDEDRNIPDALERFMAERAGARKAGRVARGPVSYPEATAQLILEAAALPVAA